MAKIPINLKTGEVNKNQELIVGIDLGTTNSLIASIVNGTTQILKDHCGNDLFVPSIIHFADNGNIIIGEEARHKLIENDGITLYSIKRLLGKSYNDLSDRKKYFGYQLDEESTEGSVRIKVRDKFYNPLELSAMLLKHLKNEAEKSTGAVINKAVISVPAYFNDAQRQTTRDAGKLAGLDVLRIINEPTAASLAYGIGLNKDESSIVAVYDLGGGTFDISILRIEDGVFDILSTRGDTYLGGDDFDLAIVEFWAKKYQIEIPTQRTLLNQLRLKAEEVRKQINTQDHASIFWNEQLFEINLPEFLQCTKALVDRTIECASLALADSQLTKSEINKVILVGGSTRMKIIRDAVETFFGQEVHTELNPDQAVAIGAAIQADILTGGRKDLLLLDVNPLSLGIETLGGLMDVVIPRNSKIPTQLAKEYTTSKDGQTKLKIAIYQGERDLVEHNRKLGEFILHNIPPMPLGLPKIQVSFRVDADGILQVKAKELRSNTEQDITINSQFSLSPEEVSKMLLNSLEFAQFDIKEKGLIDAINEAEIVISHTMRFIHQNENWLDSIDVQKLKEFVGQIKDQIKNKDKNLIEKNLEQLNNFAQPVAHQAMDYTVQNALHGKKV